ncbi:MAG: sugar ABC transporter permease [Chloroflexi bacterium]|nr:sugar ABC transporter permease [Chloroflexota bacterium]
MAINTSNSEPSDFGRWWMRTTYVRAAYLYLIPSFVIMRVITFYPLLYQVWMSFTSYDITNLRINSDPPEWVGLKNYIDILSGALSAKVTNFDFVRILSFNLIWTFTNVPIHVVTGVLIAVLLNTKGLWFKGVYRAIYILPIVLPTLVIATVWRNMFDQTNGAITLGMISLGGLFNIPPEVFRIRWFESLDPPFALFLPWQPLPWSFYAMLIANIWLGWPFMTIVATGALQSIPSDLYEAASIDGASGVQQFFNITVPLIRPAMVPAAMYGIITTFNLFNFIYMMSRGGPLGQTEILVTQAFKIVNAQQLYGVAAAFSVLIFFILLGLTLLTNAITKGTERYDI